MPPAGQFWPQAPQLAGSVVRSAQVPPQSVGAEAGQVQAPEMQLARVAHWLPHAPQLFTSLASSAHTVPQLTCVGSGQKQAPVVHTAPVGQSCPQVPQLFGSVCRSTHVLPHAFGGVPAVPQGWQTPETQTPAPHARPQAPQLFGSLDKSKHPLVVPQLTSVPVHRQAPPVHVAVEGQPLPQVPQLFMSF